MRYLTTTRDRLLEKRRRRAEREGGMESGSYAQKHEEGLFASPRVVVERGEGVKEGQVEVTTSA